MEPWGLDREALDKQGLVFQAAILTLYPLFSCHKGKTQLPVLCTEKQSSLLPFLSCECITHARHHFDASGQVCGGFSPQASLLYQLDVL